MAEEAESGILDADTDVAVHHHRPTPPATSTERRGHRRAADRQAAEARTPPARRHPDGRHALKSYGYELPRGSRRRSAPTAPQDPQRRRVRRVHRRDAKGAQLRDHHRPARRLWPRADHRRLPPRRALRRRSAPRGEAAPSTTSLARGGHGRGHHPALRGDVGAVPRAAGPQGDGVELRLRHLRALPRPHARRCSGSTSATSARSRSRTAPR